MPGESTTTLGVQVAGYRRQRKMSGEELADRAGEGLTRSMIANLENGRKADLTTRQLLAVALVLGVSPADLVFDLRRPYELIELPGGVTAAQWIARDWFGGYRVVEELFPDSRTGAFSSPPDVLARWGVPRLLRERDSISFALEAHENRLKEVSAAERAGAKVLSEPGALPTEPDLLSEKIRDFRAELYEIERQLRAARVDLAPPIVRPGAPF